MDTLAQPPSLTTAPFREEARAGHRDTTPSSGIRCARPGSPANSPPTAWDSERAITSWPAFSHGNLPSVAVIGSAPSSSGSARLRRRSF